MSSLPLKSIRWRNTLFLGGTLLGALLGVPAYIWQFGLSGWQVALFFVFFALTGLSITLGYHRLFAHLSFQASSPVRFLTLLFGAAAFENSALSWAADHRQHHKFVDHEEDPYDISRGFLHAHVGWLLFRVKPDSPLDCAKDLQADSLVAWQHRHYVPIAILMSFVLPTLIGWCFGGWTAALGSFLMAGVARIVCVHHMTFFINSLCHTLGRRPYSSRCTARDSMLMALFTFGEGYHNFHHEFQHDYRNGVNWWQFDPTKWSIWILHQFGLVRQLRRVPHEEIVLARVAEQQRRISEKLESARAHIPESIQRMLENVQHRLQQASKEWQDRKAEYRRTANLKMEASREKVEQLRRELRLASARLRATIKEWRQTRRQVLSTLRRVTTS